MAAPPTRLWDRRRAATLAVGAALLSVAAATGCGSSHHSTSTAASTPSQPAPQTTDWPTYGLNAQRTRYLPTSVVKPPYKVAWTYDAGHLMEYSPIVVGDRLYGIDNNGEAFALNTSNGKEVWRRDVATLNASAPTYADGRLYVSNLEPGQVQALNAQTGKVVWRHPLAGRTESSPLFADGKIIAGCECGSVYALNPGNGRELWSTPVGGAVKASPAFDHGTVFVGDYSGQMTAMRASNGSVEWRASAGNSIYGTAAVAFGHVYAGDLGGGFHAWNEHSGSSSWSTSTSGYVYSGATAAKTPGTPPTVYFGSYDGTVYALNALTGSTRWSRSVNGPVSGAGSMVGNVFYAGDLKTTQTWGLNPRNGDVVFQSRDGAYNPVISDGRFLYMTGYRIIYALVPAQGHSRNGFIVKNHRQAHVAP
jgi:outer membrane protein assembly factor BamB